MSLADHCRLLRSFIKRPGQVGAIAPSSGHLANRMVEWIEWDQVRHVAEFGPGTGVFTEVIIERCADDANFFAIERCPQLAQRVRDRCPDVTIFEDSVENVVECCEKIGIDQLDAVICGLPWASFPADLQERCLEALRAALRPEGQFVTFAYWQGMLLPAAHRFRRRLDDYFGDVHRSRTVWRNLPPAFVYRCSGHPE
ncbi:MAG: methyltransferase domain-containing protein [Phycisphaeraceae bacterium]|nr:methyltransferase domain-containing protein [Phycisphaeraceae bacterium]